MADRGDTLTPPKPTKMEDPGAHELDSESDDHFSDAQSAPSDSHSNSPIPKTRVEKVSGEPSYGEVPGTEAYRLREGDAEPDEIAIVPDKSKKPSGDEEAKPPTPGGMPIPKTVVEVTADSDGSESPVSKKHKADPPPDLVLKADGKPVTGEGASDTPISPALQTPHTGRSRRRSSNLGAVSPGPRSADVGGGEADDFGDDFDDFEEGGEAEDFGDFDDNFPEAEPAAPPPPARPRPQPLSFPIPDFEGLDADEILSATEPYLNALYPQHDDVPSLPPLSSKDNPIFLTPRSASLWTQLVAPPPLQPPDWIRSRIRRLFLVSLGVPVDLDEILPASKQKKLVLPSLSHRDSPRTSTDSRTNISRLRQGDANASTTSLDSQGKAKESSRRRRGPLPEPQLDLVAAQQLCMMTDEALDGMTGQELQKHVGALEAMEGTAKEVLEYWKKRADEKIGDREAFEGVIENLVKHARKVRK